MIHARIKDVDLKFETESSIFSPNSIDNGTLAMLSEIDFLPGDNVLDLGCGYGVVGILAGKLIGEERVMMCDISERAVEYASINAALNGVPHLSIRLSDGYQNIEENDFTLILSNPPYHADFSVPKKFIEVVFGGVKVREREGYYVFVAEKRSPIIKKKTKPAKRLSKK